MRVIGAPTSLLAMLLSPQVDPMNSRYLHPRPDTGAGPTSLSSTTCSARTSPSTILRHRPRSPAPERSSGLKRYSPDIHIPTYPIHSTGYLERPTHFQRYGRSRLSRLSRKRPMTAPRKLARKYGPNLLRHLLFKTAASIRISLSGVSTPKLSPHTYPKPDSLRYSLAFNHNSYSYPPILLVPYTRPRPAPTARTRIAARNAATPKSQQPA